MQKSPSKDYSIIIPYYNHKNFIQECIQSIIPFKNYLHLIIVNDNSPDFEKELFDKLKQRIDFQLIHNKSNRGIVETIKIGLRFIETKYVSILASDDKILKTRISVQLKTISDNNYKVMYSRHLEQSLSNNLTEIFLKPFYKSYMQNTHFKYITGRDYGLPLLQSAIFETNTFKNLIEENNSKLDDWPILIESFKSYEAKYIDLPTFVYRLHSENSFKNYKRYLLPRLKILLKYNQGKSLKTALGNLQYTLFEFEFHFSKKKSLKYLFLSLINTKSITPLIKASKFILYGTISRLNRG